MTTSGEKTSRYHALDSLRGHMMILAIVVHSLAAYGVKVGDVEFWDISDKRPSLLVNLLGLYLHSFRLQLFFVLAGFFAALLCDRRGLHEFLVNRRKRIVYPLIVALMICYPLIMIGFAYGKAAGNPHALSIGFNAIKPGAVNREGPLSHLWFLYYLLYYYSGVCGLVALAKRIPTLWHNRGTALFRRAVQSPLRPLWFALISMPTLFFSPVLAASTVFMPNLGVLLGYGVYFYAGWFLYAQRDLIPLFSHRAGLLIGLSLLFTITSLVGLMKAMGVKGVTDYGGLAVVIVSQALLAWCMVFGLMGLYGRHLSKESEGGRYLSDASYWIYLAHMPVVIWLQAWMTEWAIPGIVKAGLVFSIAFAFTLLTYDLFVRSTFLGEALNGKRLPRRFLMRSKAQSKDVAA